MGDFLVVGVSPDSLVKKYKGCKPIFSFEQRVEILRAIKWVDKVILQKKLFDVEQFKKLGASIYVIGSDWRGREDKVFGLKWLKDTGHLRYVSYTKKLSTSLVKEKIIKDAYNIIRAQIKRDNDK